MTIFLFNFLHFSVVWKERNAWMISIVVKSMNAALIVSKIKFIIILLA